MIFAMTRPDNAPSQAVMKRLGLAYRKDVIYRDVDSVWFDIDRESFRELNQRR
jgi:[ribosomal protein S5]-alanine N-acetyltransferase